MLESLMQFLYRAPIGLVQTSLDGVVEMMNPMAASLLIPISNTGELHNLFVSLAKVAPQLSGLVKAFGQPNGTICESLSIPLHDAAHANRPQVLRLSLMKLDATRLMATISDSTLEDRREREALSSGLIAAARVDLLTQMPNRDVILEVIQQAIGRMAAAPDCDLAVIFINCDRFKQINDGFGHAAGDEILHQMADRLRSTLRPFDRTDPAASRETMAARVGGDEFVVVLQDLHYPDDVHAVAQRLIAVLGRPYSVHARQVYCSVSMGVLLRAQINGDADSALQDASTAMVEAKRGGGARYVVFESAMAERASLRSGVESELRRAITEDELFVVYQPVVGFQKKGDRGDDVDRTAGVEALIRWQHPDRGIVPPSEFIGIAEECGLIGAIGDIVLGIACRDFVRWQKTLGACAPRLLAVNLSRGQLHQTGFVASIDHILRKSGMTPLQLQLEITESLAAQDAAVQDILHELKALGLTLALDDFGTGYSSLASLHLLPVDTIKIDRSFVSESVTSAHHRVLIKATVQVAASLNMGTVAEGIETRAQADVVRRLGCQKGQGFLYSEPLPASGLVEWLTRQRIYTMTY
jgi:diguanylate cyclase (GGDEF)-like protein